MRVDKRLLKVKTLKFSSVWSVYSVVALTDDRGIVYSSFDWWASSSLDWVQINGRIQTESPPCNKRQVRSLKTAAFTEK